MQRAETRCLITVTVYWCILLLYSVNENIYNVCNIYMLYRVTLSGQTKSSGVVLATVLTKPNKYLRCVINIILTYGPLDQYTEFHAYTKTVNIPSAKTCSLKARF